MPVTSTYPGVYIEEIPSGVHTITGVATAIAAFVGRALRGPVNQAQTINSFADFERIFGGLWVDGAMGFGVRDFFLNGGGQAVIVRLYHPPDGTNPVTQASLSVDTLRLQAISPGAWGNNLRARVDYDVSADVAARYGLTQGDLFNLSVRDMDTGTTEVFRNVSVKPGPQQVDRVLLNGSTLVNVAGALPAAIPQASDAALETRAQASNPNASDRAAALTELAKPPFSSDQRSSGVAQADQASDGDALDANDFIGPGLQAQKQGLYALEQTDLFNLLCLPPYLASGDVDATVVSAAASYCEGRRAILLVDPPSAWTSKDAAKTGVATDPGVGTVSANAALYFPRLRQPNPLLANQVEDFAPSGAVAGVIARTDSQRGVWKAPAGLDATLSGVPQLSVALTDAEIGELNPLAVNCLRTAPAAGRVVWGARTLQGADRLASEWKYLPVRRLALYLEESLYRGTQWVVFEPNDALLWGQIRLNVGAFMQTLFRQGAFQGNTPAQAYFVKCDSETTTQNDIDNGVVNIVVGFAPLKPAEFVIIQIQQLAGQIQA